MYIFKDVKDVHYTFSKDIHLHKIYYISSRWRREEGAAAPMIKRLMLKELSNLQ